MARLLLITIVMALITVETLSPVVILADSIPAQVAYLAVDEVESRNAIEAAKQAYEAKGYQTVCVEYFDPSTADFSPHLTRIKFAKPNILVTCVPVDTWAIIESQIEGFGGWDAIKVLHHDPLPSAPPVSPIPTETPTTPPVVSGSAGYLAIAESDTRDFVENVRQSFEADGYETVYIKFFQATTSDFLAELARVKHASPDVLLTCLPWETWNIIEGQIEALGGWGNIEVRSLPYLSSPPTSPKPTPTSNSSTVGYLSIDDADAKSFIQGVRQSSEADGGETVFEQYVPLGTADFSPHLTRIRYINPDALVICIPLEMRSTIERQITELGGWGVIKVQDLPYPATTPSIDTTPTPDPISISNPDPISISNPDPSLVSTAPPAVSSLTPDDVSSTNKEFVASSSAVSPGDPITTNGFLTQIMSNAQIHVAEPEFLFFYCLYWPILVFLKDMAHNNDLLGTIAFTDRPIYRW